MMHIVASIELFNAGMICHIVAEIKVEMSQIKAAVSAMIIS